MIIFLLMNFITGSSSFLLTYRIFKFGNFIDSLLAWFILYFAQIITTELALGILGILYLKNVVLLNLAILLIIWFITRNKRPSLNLISIKDSVSELLANKVILLCTCVILGFGLVKVFINLINPPFGWDSLNYHFTFPVEWLKNGNLDIPITISDDPSPSYYPINGSLFFLWFMFPLKNAFLADLGQVPFFILAFMAVYNISKKLGLDRELSFYAAALFLLTPNVFKQLEIAYVDVMVVALFLSCINFLLALYNALQLKNLVLWSISFGLLLGTKTLAVVYGIFPFLFFILVLLKVFKRVNLKKMIIYLIIFISLVAILGGFIYTRNFIQTRNPLYPADIEILGKKIFKGVMPFSTYRGKWTQEEFNLEKFLFHEGIGAQFIILIIPAIFLSVPIFFIKYKKENNLALSFMVSLPILLYLSFWFFMPQLWVRYLYPALGISFITAMYIVGLLKIPKNFLRVMASICFLASAAELSGHLELVSSFILSMLFFLLLPKIINYRFNLSLNLIILIFLFIGLALYYLNINYDKYEFSRYLLRSPFPKEERETWVWLNDNSKGEKIAYVGRPDVLPLYGSHFKNDVIYISVNNVHPARLHYFPNATYIWSKDFMTLHKNLEKPNNYRRSADYSIWLKNLRAEDTDYLLVYSLHQVKYIVFPIEDNWATAHPEIFNLAFKNSTVHIYKITK